MNKQLGQYIRKLRLERGESLRSFAGFVGISPAHQCDIEKGRRRPSDAVLIGIASRLRVPTKRLREMSNHGR